MKLKVPEILRSFHGPMTQELVLSPAKYGLGKVPSQPAGIAKTVCGFCSTGCGLKVHLNEKGQAINLTPDTDYPVNMGMACPKGWEALTPLAASDRATHPLLNGEMVDWDTALQAFCRRFQAIMNEHGRDSVAFLSTGQMMCEEMAFLGALTKFGMGWIHGDGNTRQCMATAVTAYKESFGFDAPPFSYDDFEESDVLVFIGANPCIAHPIMWQRVLKNPQEPMIIVIDPRRTETAMCADLHVPLKPKTDLLLLYSLAQRLIEMGAVDANFISAHTEGYEEFKSFVEAYKFTAWKNELSIDEEIFDRLATAIAKGNRVSFWWTMGVNQSHEGTRTAQAIINLALMTGNVGRPGTGANSITGQCNAMGSRLFSNTTNLFGGRDFKNPLHREEVAKVLDIPVSEIPDRPSLAYDQILEGIEKGEIKGLWIIATNTAHSWIHQKRARKILKKLDFLVVQDMYHNTETAQLAGLILPAAGWGEKEGTFINSERRVGVTRKVSRAPGQALADFYIFQLISEYWGCSRFFKTWTSPEAVFEKLQMLTKNRPCDISGIRGYDMIVKLGGVQWPFREDDVSQPRKRLFEDGCFFTESRRAKFVFEAPRVQPEQVDLEFPLVLLTGRGTSAQWHTQTRTSKSLILRKLYSEELQLELHPEDASVRKIENGQWVKVRSRRAEIRARAFLTPNIGVGQVFLPMHDPLVNQLTAENVDPYSRQPSYKHCAVQVLKEV